MKNVFLIGILSALSLASFSQKNIRLRSQLSYGRALSNVWGYADSSGNEYGLVGLYDGLSIVDVTNPDSINEIFHVPGPLGSWREIKTWKNYAYATNETGRGLLIVDLSSLPDSVNYSYWTADTLFRTAHTLFIDENGILYLFGYNDSLRTIPFDKRGALICNLNPDPENPTIIGRYSADYVHDGYVKNDTLWAAQISEGNFAVVDVSDKANPVVITTQETPSHFTHSCWLSDGHQYLFTADERSGAFITSFDISDAGNIFELDRWQADPGSGLIPHNIYFRNNFLINAYYKYGMNIIDATNPAHLVEVGFYDTSPFPNADGFHGCWGVYPFFPSGTILASDIETGLYVLTPDYVRACYLVGNVTDDSTGRPDPDVSVEIMATGIIENTDVDGNFKMGAADPGLYDVRFYKSGCLPKIVSGVDLQRGIVTTLNAVLTCTTFVNVTSPVALDIMLEAMPSVFENQAAIRYHFPKSDKAELQLFDYSAKMLSEITLHDSEGEVVLGSLLPKGIYLVRLRSSSISRVVRIVKT